MVVNLSASCHLATIWVSRKFFLYTTQRMFGDSYVRGQVLVGDPANKCRVLLQQILIGIFSIHCHDCTSKSQLFHEGVLRYTLHYKLHFCNFSSQNVKSRAVVDEDSSICLCLKKADGRPFPKKAYCHSFRWCNVGIYPKGGSPSRGFCDSV
mgnify:CR=1 FL=1